MGTSVSFGNYAPLNLQQPVDFDIMFSLDQEKTVVPLGILDFDNNYENPYFSFRYALTGSPLESLNFMILDDEGNCIYNMTYLEPIIVTASRKSAIVIDAKKGAPAFDPENPVKSWNYRDLFAQHRLTEPDFTQPGSYVLHWDGFDNNEVYDSRNFNGKKLKAQITAYKDGQEKVREVEFTTSYKEVKWTDVKIDRKAQRIDVELRVNLKDGGAHGLEAQSYRDPLDDPRIPAHRTRYPWEAIPQNELNRIGKPPVTTLIRPYSQLNQLAIEGLNYHWGRNRNHAAAKNVTISGTAYEVFVNAINIDDDERAIDDLDLVFNTNGTWMRSGNPGTVQDLVSAVGNLVSREAICYNVGYLRYSNGWGYTSENREDLSFKDTSAHEIGHTILKAYGGTAYSYGHKGSVHVMRQKQKSSAPQFPVSGEIDIMPYFRDNALGGEHQQPNYFARRVAAEKDLLSLIWLTKLSIK